MTINPFILHGEELTPVRKLLYLKALAGGAPLSEYEVTGNPVSFNTNVAKPLSVLAAFSPVQAGSGDPSPENIRSISGFSSAKFWRTGKNLLDPNERNDLYAANIQYNYTNPLKLPAGTYTASCSIECSGIYILEGNSNIFSKYNSTFITFTLTEPKSIKINFYKEGIDHTADCQLEVGSTETAYSPYTGESVSVTFPALGKNLFDVSTIVKGTLDSYGNLIANDNRRVSAFITLPAGTYVASRKTAPDWWKLWAYTQDETPLRSIFDLPGTSRSFTLTEETKVRFAFDYVVTSDDEVQLESGSSATAYEPYNATAYGGTLDLSTGVLTVEWGKTFLDSMAFQEYGSTDSVTQYYTSSIDTIAKDRADRMSNVFHKTDTKEAWAVRLFDSSGKTYFCTPKDEYGSAEAFKTAMQALGAYIVYELATPLVYQLSPVEILSLIGDNTIWTDTNGENTIRYKKKG